MTHHWPIAVSALLISGALALGLYQHENAISNSALKTPDSAPATATPAPNTVTPAQNNLSPAAPAPTAQPALQTQTTEPTQTTQPTQPTPPVQTGAVDVTRPVITKPALNQPPPLPIAGKPGTPGAMQGAAQAQKILSDLRVALQTSLDVPVIPLPGGGFAFSPLGARVDVQPPPNWTISVYNVVNGATDAETDTYKQAIQTITTSLAIDMSPPPVVTDTGKSSLKTACKLGRVSIDRDPGNANAYLITPLQPRVQ